MKRLVLLLGMGLVTTVIALMPAGSAQAADHTPARHSATAQHRHHAAPVSRHGHGPKHIDLNNPPVTLMASSWCGNFWRGAMWCINFNRSEQKWLAGLSVTAAGAAICSSTGIGCVVAATVGYALIKYVDAHGICPLSKPVLEVEYAPWPGGYVACSNG